MFLDPEIISAETPDGINILHIDVETKHPILPDGEIIIAFVATDPDADYTFIPVNNVVNFSLVLKKLNFYFFILFFF